MSARHARRNVRWISRVLAAASIGIAPVVTGTVTGSAYGTAQAAVSMQQMHASRTAAEATGHFALNASPREYTVSGGDTLSGIARKEYGSAACWPGIYRANSAHISNPDLIYPGQVLGIPDGCDSSPVSVTVAVTSSAPVPKPSAPVSGGGGGGGYYGSVLSYTQIEELWESAGGPAWAASQSATIAECESGGNRYAYNPSGATGIWQILGAVVPGDLTDPQVNAANAVAKFEASGDTWAQWVCQP